MNVLCVIPARYGSKRFPGKPLASDTGRPLIQHVYEAAAGASRVDTVVVATDDDRIRHAVEGFGGRCVMTRADHPCGTNRVAEAAEAVGGADVVINVQGDEPDLAPALLDALIRVMEDNPAMEAATLAGPLADEEWDDPGAVKVVTDGRGDALYFSRAPIPCARDGEASRRAARLKHVGIYAYRIEALRDYAMMPPSPLEQTERLEQLRWLEAGRRMFVLVTDHHPGGIDTPDDYAAFVRRWRQRTDTDT